MDRLFLGLATLSFLAGFVLSVRSLRGCEYRPLRPSFFAIAVGFLLQSVFLSIRGEIHRSCPIVGTAELLVFVAWSMAGIYLILGTTYRLSLLGLFTSPIVILAQIPALFLPFDQAAARSLAAKSEAASVLRETHIALALIAYGAFAMSFVAAVMFLLLNGMLKARKPNPLLLRLPPLANLSHAGLLLLITGFLLLSVAIITAWFLPGHTRQDEYPKLILTHFMWVSYAILLILEFTRRLTPHTRAGATAAIFAIPMLSFLVL